MLTAGEVIQAARDIHPAFDDRRNPDGVALRALSRYQRELHGRVAQIRPQELSAEHREPLPLVSHEAGIVLPAWRAIDRVFALSSSGREQIVELLPEVRVNDLNSPRLAAYTRSQVLYLSGTPPVWNGYVELVVRFVPMPQALARLQDELLLPESAEGALVAFVAAVFGARGHMDPALPPIPTGLAEEHARREAEFLADIGNANTAEVWRVRDLRGGA